MISVSRACCEKTTTRSGPLVTNIPANHPVESEDRACRGFRNYRIRVLPDADCPQPADALFARGWTVAADSNRQGLRLGGQMLTIADRGERVSEPVVPGTLQLPPDGTPIVLLADAQTHGGYPRIGHAIRADWPLLAQLRPGDRVRFVACTPDAARLALCRQRQRLHRIALALDAKRPARA